MPLVGVGRFFSIIKGRWLNALVVKGKVMEGLNVWQNGPDLYMLVTAYLLVLNNR